MCTRPLATLYHRFTCAAFLVDAQRTARRPFRLRHIATAKGTVFASSLWALFIVSLYWIGIYASVTDYLGQLPVSLLLSWVFLTGGKHSVMY